MGRHGATGTKGCAVSREDPLGRSEAPQRALYDDAAPRARQGLALENGQSPHALLAHRVAADERHRRGVDVDGVAACFPVWNYLLITGRSPVDTGPDFSYLARRRRRAADRRVTWTER